jgi:phospholipid transport system substrate-binding protein
MRSSPMDVVRDHLLLWPQDRPRVTLRLMVIVLAMVACVLLGGKVEAATVTSHVRGYTDRALQVLGDPSLSPAQRDATLRAIARQLFDPEEAARRALGRHWQNRTPAERAEFTELFARLLERTYLTRLGSYKDARLTYVGEVVDGSFAIVRAKVLIPEQIEVPVEARLHRRGEQWYAYDIVVEGISLIGNYRAQFDKIIRTTSYEELVRRLRARVAVLQSDVK